MNLWRGTCRVLGTGWQVVSQGVAIESRDGHPPVPDGRELFVGVRPHDIDLVPGGEGDGVGDVDIVEPFGPATLIHLRVDGLADERVRVVVPAETRIEIGERRSFRVRRDRMHLFDGTTERRIGS
jgi:ABC-type sugar transport system ATPase subunit